MRSDELTEYRLKTAFIYNFIIFTEWPAATDKVLNLCVYGSDPFGDELESLQGKLAATRIITVHRKPAGESLKKCQVVFLASSTIKTLPKVLESLQGQTVLTVADSPGAIQGGVVLNMALVGGKISFEANLRAARLSGVELSSKLLRLATNVLL